MADSTPFLVINPHADDKRLGKKVDKILDIAKDIFGDIEHAFTTKIGDGIPIAEKAVKDGFKTLIAVGGDGTLNELVNVAALNPDIKVGMIAGGSACDSHKTHGIPKDFRRAFEIIDEGYTEKFPVGKIKGDSERYFTEMINGAFIGATSAALYDRFEWAHGELGYAYAAIRVAMKFKPIPTKVTIDNKIVREANLSTFAVALTDCISDFIIVPENHPRKGDFAIFLCRDLTGFGLVRLIIQALSGKHVKNEKVEILRGKHVLIESETPHMWESEGEMPSKNATKIETDYIPDAVNLFIPKKWQYGLPKKERDKMKKKVLKKQPPFDY